MADAVVWRRLRAARPRRRKEVVISQHDMMFMPFVTVIPVGSTVTFTNLDPFRHHVYSFSAARPSPGQSGRHHARRPGRQSALSMSRAGYLRAAVDAAFAADDRRVMHFETPYGATICKMVGLGLGVGIVNPLVARMHAAGWWSGHSGRGYCFVSYLLLARNRPANVLVDRFIERLKELIAAETASCHRGYQVFV